MQILVEGWRQAASHEVLMFLASCTYVMGPSFCNCLRSLEVATSIWSGQQQLPRHLSVLQQHRFRQEGVDASDSEGWTFCAMSSTLCMAFGISTAEFVACLALQVGDSQVVVEITFLSVMHTDQQGLVARCHFLA